MSAYNNIVLGSLSLRCTEVIRSTATNNDVLQASSLRIAMNPDPAAIDNKVMRNVSLPIAGYQHPEGAWSDPESLAYVVVHM